MAFGTSPFGTSPFATVTPASASQSSGQIVSSRLFDASGNPEQMPDGTGAFKGMSDALSRARILLLSTRSRSKVIDSSWPSSERKRVEDALRDLTKGPSPQLEIVEVVAETRGSTGNTHVRVRDLTNGGRVEVLDASPRFY